jgi:putative transposase
MDIYIEPYMLPKGHGRPRIHSLREILNAIFYVLRSGCQWRLLPHDFPRWPTVYHYFRKWRLVSSQPVRTTGVGGEERSCDSGKKIEGRKRHLLVDTEGFVLQARVNSAKVMDHEGIKLLLILSIRMGAL